MGAIFLDRDGVINRERADYVKEWAEFEFLPGVLGALSRLATLRLPILVITNQSGIGRGHMARQVVDEIHERMRAVVAAAGGRIDEVFVCPHHPAEGCHCRKPRPGLLQQAAERYAVALNRSYFVGDSYTDLQAARAAGCQPLLVASGRQGAVLPGLLKDEPQAPLLADLSHATTLLLERFSRESELVFDTARLAGRLPMLPVGVKD
jgi:D-glycero-D-manno-heptose 1,7-bisphosphate phosphatase